MENQSPAVTPVVIPAVGAAATPAIMPAVIQPAINPDAHSAAHSMMDCVVCSSMAAVMARHMKTHGINIKEYTQRRDSIVEMANQIVNNAMASSEPSGEPIDRPCRVLATIPAPTITVAAQLPTTPPATVVTVRQRATIADTALSPRPSIDKIRQRNASCSSRHEISLEARRSSYRGSCSEVSRNGSQSDTRDVIYIGSRNGYRNNRQRNNHRNRSQGVNRSQNTGRNNSIRTGSGAHNSSGTRGNGEFWRPEYRGANNCGVGIVKNMYDNVTDAVANVAVDRAYAEYIGASGRILRADKFPRLLREYKCDGTTFDVSRFDLILGDCSANIRRRYPKLMEYELFVPNSGGRTEVIRKLQKYMQNINPTLNVIVHRTENGIEIWIEDRIKGRFVD